MNFELSGEAREAEGRAEALLQAEAAAVAGLPGLDGTGLRRLLLAVQRALPGEAGAEVAARLALARASPSLLLGVEATRHLSVLLEALGPRALPEAERDALRRGERIGAVALADAAGAGPARLEVDGGGWRLTGTKSFVTNGPLGDWIGVVAGSGGRQALCLVSPRDPGVRPGERMELMGLDGLAVSSLALEGAPLPAARVLGPFEGRPVAERYAGEADLSVAVAAAGLMRSVLTAAKGHALSHQRDGRPVFARQEVAFKLAEVLALTEAAELICHRAAWLRRTGDPEAATVARCAKVFCAEGAERAAGACLQVTAGEGYRRGTATERAWRDAKGLSLCGTTAEVARMAIADDLLSRA